METGATAVVGRGVVEILPDFKKWGQQLAADMRLARTQLDGSAAGLRRSAATVGKSMAVVGKGTAALGLGVAAVSVKMAADFQSHTAVLQTAAGETSKGLAVVRDGIKNIAVGTGTGIQNLTDGMYTIEKAGFRGADGLKILKAAAQGAREENAKLSDVTNAMTSVMASYHLPATKSVQVMNAMKTAAGEGKITMEEFSGALSTVLPIASANHIAFEDVAGSMATLTQHGTSAREATHELAATIRALASPNQVASREMARFGLSATDVSTKLGQRGLSGTVNLLVETIFKRMGPAGVALQKTFEGTKQSSQDAQIMLGKMSGQTKDIAQQYLKGKISIGDWNKVLKGSTVDQRPMLQNFKVLVDRSRGFSRELKNGGPASQTFTDALKKMSGGAIGLNTILQITGESAAGNAERIKKVGESFHHNSKDVEGWKITAGLLNVQLDRMKAQFQVLAINIGTKLIPVVSAVTGFFVAHKGVLVALVAVLLAFITATAAAYIGMKLYSAGAKVAAAAQWIYNTAMTLGTKAALGTRIQLALLTIQEKAMAVATKVAAAAQWLFNAAMDANPITLVVIAIAALVAAIVWIALKTDWFQKAWHAVWGLIKKPVMAFVHWLKDNWQLVVFTILTGPIGFAAVMIVRHWDAVKGAFMFVFNWVKDHWVLIASLLLGPITAAAYQIYQHWGTISNGAKAAYHAVVGWFVKMGTDIGGFFAKLPGQIGGFFSRLPGIVAGFFSSASKAVADWTVSAAKAVADFFTKLPARVSKAATGFSNALTGAGMDLIKGLWKGASDFFTKSVPDFFKMLWHGLVDFFKAVFEIHSPSGVFADLGVSLMQGMFGGMLSIAKGAAVWLKTHVYQPLVNFFVGAGTWLYNQGKSTISGAIRGYAAIAATLHGWLSSHIYQPIIGFFKGAGSWLYNQGRNTVTGFFSGLKNIWAAVSSWLHGRPGSIRGVIGDVTGLLYQKGKDVLNSLLNGLKQPWKDLTGWVSGIAKWIKDHKGPISLDMRLLTPAGKALMKGLLKGLKIGFKDVGDFVYGTGNNIADITKMIGSTLLGSVGLGKAGPVSRFRDQIALALRLLGQPIGFMGLVEKRMNQESGGNPTIVNKWDSNWKAGHPSVGLMQVIRGTFAAYAGKYRKTGPFEYGVSVDPMANIYAALNYALHAYGSLNALGRPGGYDQGGIARGMGYMPKWTNQPERVLSPRQTVAFESLVGAISGPGRGGGGGTVVIQASLVNHGVIASKQEAEDWLVSGLEAVGRRNRIPASFKKGK